MFRVLGIYNFEPKVKAIQVFFCQARFSKHVHRFDTHFRYHPHKGKLDLENWWIFTSSKNVPNLFPELLLPVNGNCHF